MSCDCSGSKSTLDSVSLVLGQEARIPIACAESAATVQFEFIFIPVREVCAWIDFQAEVTRVKSAQEEMVMVAFSSPELALLGLPVQ